MKIVAISDTHGKHDQLHLPKGDMIIHAGDVSMKGYKTQIIEFLDWFSQLDFKYKIFIAGNHDFYFEDHPREEVNSFIPENVIYLENESVEIEGIKIWGSPISPWFYDWAFNRQRGPEINSYWQQIPSDTNIVVTHGPVHGILDKTTRNYSVGCEDLYEKIMTIKPKHFICGHIHEAYGETFRDDIHFVNASILNVEYLAVNEPICFDF